jgi:thiamine pyrophosphate-dependent acetolactate synthase large subunit-like protein
MDGATQIRIAARRRALAKRQDELRRRRASVLAEQWNHRPMTEARLGAEVWEAVKDTDFVLTAGAPEVIDGAWQIPGPERDVSGVASGSLGAETAMTLGAALALKGTGKLPVGIVGDGAYLMFPQTLWTAVHYQIPALWIVANNRSYFNDEMHQDTVARMRGRPIKNRWIAQRMEEPPVDFAALARPFGAEGFGPVEDPDELARVLRRAVEVVRAGGAAVVDVHVADRASI